MNPIGIFALLIALVTGYYAFGGQGFSLPDFGLGGGPIATGPGFGTEIQNPQPISRGFFGLGQPPAPEEVPVRPGESPHKDKVTITEVRRSGTSPDEEHVTIRYGGGIFGFGRQGGDPPINVTGWRISSRKSMETIPRAYNIPEIDAGEWDILLPPGGEVIILVGQQDYRRNFRENACVGYLNEFYRFTPSLSDSCPDSRPDRSELLSRGFNGECIRTIEAVPTCRAPSGPFEAGVIGSSCIDYMHQNFSYAGCVKNFRDRAGFLENTWRVSLRRPAKMFDSLHDRVTLRDTQGLVVDEYEY